MNNSEKLYFVYILQSITTGQFYVDSCNNLLKRFNEHQSNGYKDTRGRGPWWLPYYEICKSEKEAKSRVSDIRKKKSSRYIQTIIYRAYPLMNLD